MPERIRRREANSNGRGDAVKTKEADFTLYCGKEMVQVWAGSPSARTSCISTLGRLKEFEGTNEYC